MTTITYSAPGNLMLFGEHAVLHGRLAVVCAVDRRVRATLTPRPDRTVRILSALATHETDLDRLDACPALRFAMTAIQAYRGRIPTGFDLAIESAFSHTIGFGSSAAVTVVTHAALQTLTGGAHDPHALLRAARDTIRTVQGLGSGADAAAAIFGGLVGYRAEPLEVRPVAISHPLTAVYSGSKLPTPEVIAIVEARRKAQPELFASMYTLMEQTAEAALAAAVSNDWKSVGELMTVGQGLMEAIGVSNKTLAAIVHTLRADPGILGAKISGSGLGDCAVGLGRARQDVWPGDVLQVSIDPAGLRRE